LEGGKDVKGNEGDSRRGEERRGGVSRTIEERFLARGRMTKKEEVF